MLNSLRAVARYVQGKIGWNRIGVLLSLVIIGVAVVVLFHMLRDIKVNEVVRALKAIEPQQTALATLFVAGGYFTLTFYDWFALRTIGRKEIPYRIAALAGFTSYSIGHNVDATQFTGSVARLVGIEGGVVSGVFNLESSGVEAPDWRPRHDEHYHEA